MSLGTNQLFDFVDSVRETPQPKEKKYKYLQVESAVEKSQERKKDVPSYDQQHYWQGIENYLNHSIDLRQKFAWALFKLVCLEVGAFFAFVFLYGFGVIRVGQWLFALIVTGILGETFFVIRIIVNNLFPKVDALEHLKNLPKQ